ncbi:MAG: VWA domain-containing protein [Verrucomicrobiota bacterium]
MRFADTEWILVAVIAVPVLLLLNWLAGANSRRILRRILGPVFSKQLVLPASKATAALSWGLLLAGIVFLTLALARPLLSERPEQVDRLGIDFLVAVDVSKSMLAEDVEPNRMEAAKEALRNLLGRLVGDRMGLLAFAGEARMVAPLTFDSTALDKVIDSIDENILWLGGTKMSDVIELAIKKFEEKELDTRVLVLISDGENLEGDAVLMAREAFLEYDIRIYTIGVGTPIGARIPLHQRNNEGEIVRTRYVRGPDRRDVISSLDERTLKRIAEATNGRYYKLDDEMQTIDLLFESGLRPLAKRVVSEETEEPVEGYRIFLIPGILCLFAQSMINTRKRRQTPTSP